MKLRRAGLFMAVATLTSAVSLSPLAAVSGSTSDHVLDRTILDTAISPSRGLSHSTYNRPELWTLKDKSDSTRIFAVGAQGETKAVLTIKGAKRKDWADIAPGRNHALWVGDIGDHGERRTQINVYEVQEPEALSSLNAETRRFSFTYPDGAHHAEGLMVHPETGRLYVVTRDGADSAIYAAPTSLVRPGLNPLTRVADAPQGVTGASFAPDGTLVLVTNELIYAYASVGAEPTVVPNVPGSGHKSVTFTADGTSLLISSSGPSTPIYRKSRPNPNDALLWGMSYNGGEDPTDFEQRVGADVELRRFFVPSQNVSSALRGIREDIAAGREATQVSFKLDATWAQAAAGASDTWARDAAAQLAAAVEGTDHLVQVAIHHEPENDTGANDGSTIAGRDAWVDMQARLGPIFRDAGVEYGAVIMGHHSMPLSGGNTEVWLLEKWLPRLAGRIDFLGLDVYKASYDVTGFGNRYAAYTDAQTEAIGATWGLSESAISPEGFSTRPTWFEDLNRVLIANDATFYAYFNTGLNNGLNQLFMSPGDVREQAFVEVVKAHQQ